jgi:hypothetical protein
MLYVAHPVPASYQSLTCAHGQHNKSSCMHVQLCTHMHKKIDMGNLRVRESEGSSGFIY